MAPTRILIVDDDPKLQAYLSRGLEESGMSCVTASSAEDASALLPPDDASEPFDLILLDVMMSGRNGWDFLGELRGAGLGTPVIFVSARGSVEERVKGLRLGADDYIVKPFAFEELLARIDAVIRRRQSLPILRRGAAVIDPVHRSVRLAGKPVDLSPKEYALLVALVESAGTTLSRTELLRKVWGIEFDPETNVVDVHIARLRRRLGADHKDQIATIKGEGYRFL